MRRERRMLKKIFLAGLAFGFVSCSSHYVIVPPVMDLMTVEPVGLVMFSVENAKGELDQMATQAFLQEATGYQRVPVLEIGKLEDILGKLDLKALDQDAARAIGERYKVKSFFHGEIRVSKVKRQVDVAGVLHGNLRIRASLDIAVTCRLISAETGATLWTNSDTLNGTLGLLSIGEDGVPYFGVRDQDEATVRMLRELMFELTWDFRPTKRRI
jgi:hypothetical protein